MAFSPDGSAGASAADPAPASSDAPAAAASAAEAPVRPDYIPEAFWKADAGAPDVEALAKGYSELAGFKAEVDAKLTGLPESPDGYALTLPEDFKLPDGMKFEVDAANPLVKAVQQFAFDNKLPPAAVQTLAKAHVETMLSELDAGRAAIAEAHGRLGEKSGERLAAVQSFAKANLSADEAEAITEALHTGYGDRVVSALEKIIAKANGAIPGAPPQSINPQNSVADLASKLFPSMKR